VTISFIKNYEHKNDMGQALAVLRTTANDVYQSPSCAWTTPYFREQLLNRELLARINGMSFTGQAIRTKSAKLSGQSRAKSLIGYANVKCIVTTSTILFVADFTTSFVMTCSHCPPKVSVLLISGAHIEHAVAAHTELVS